MEIKYKIILVVKINTEYGWKLVPNTVARKTIEGSRYFLYKEEAIADARKTAKELELKLDNS